MSVKRYNGSSWVDINTVKRYSNGSWVDCDFIKVYENGRWVEKWSNWNSNLLSESMRNKTLDTYKYSYSNGLYADWFDTRILMYSLKDTYDIPFEKGYTYLHVAPYSYLGYDYTTWNPTSSKLAIGFANYDDPSVPIKVLNTYSFTRRTDEEEGSGNRFYGANERDLNEFKVSLSTINSTLGAQKDNYNAFGLFIVKSSNTSQEQDFSSFFPYGYNFMYIGVDSLYFD